MIASTFRWLQRKRYQYEVTFSLYMLTPTEKFIFNSFLFLFFSMIIIALTLYLPQRITFITDRAWFYYTGDSNSKTAVHSIVESATRSVMVEKVKESVISTGRQTIVGGMKGEL